MYRDLARVATILWVFAMVGAALFWASVYFVDPDNFIFGEVVLLAVSWGVLTVGYVATIGLLLAFKSLTPDRKDIPLAPTVLPTSREVLVRSAPPEPPPIAKGGPLRFTTTGHHRVYRAALWPAIRSLPQIVDDGFRVIAGEGNHIIHQCLRWLTVALCAANVVGVAIYLARLLR